MRIFYGHDYYDSTLAHGGHDDPICYIRHKDKTVPYAEVRDIGIKPPSPNILVGTERETYRRYRRRDEFFTPKGVFGMLNYPTVVFCGKLYTGVRVTLNPDMEGMERHYFWDHDALKSYFDRIGVQEVTYTPPSKRFLQFTGYDNDVHLNDVFTPVVLSEASRNWLIDNKITVMTFDGQKWRVDGDDLKDVCFYKLFDAYTAYSEIEMWVGGVLSGSDRPMVELSDDMKAAKHGYDKWSFRKPPEERK